MDILRRFSGGSCVKSSEWWYSSPPLADASAGARMSTTSGVLIASEAWLAWEPEYSGGKDTDNISSRRKGVGKRGSGLEPELN